MSEAFLSEDRDEESGVRVVLFGEQNEKGETIIKGQMVETPGK